MAWLIWSIFTTVTAAGGRLDSLRKAPGQNPAVPSAPLPKASTALQEQRCCTQKHGAKPRGPKCQQEETVRGELLSATLQEPEPSCVSCPETPQLVPKCL